MPAPHSLNSILPPQISLIMISLSLAFLSSVCAATAQEAAFAEHSSPVGSAENLDDVTNHVIAKELELQKLNAHFRLESTRQPRWRAWRQFAYSETNASCTEAGLIARMALSYPFMKRPATIYKLSTVSSSSAGKVKKVLKVTTSLSKAPRPNAQLVERAATTQMIGQLIGAAGDIFELSSNVITSIKDRKRGFDPRTYARTVDRTSKELDELLAQRDEIVKESSTFSTHELELANAEGAILHDVRDLALLQYAQYHSGARKLKFFQNAAYVLNITKNAAGAAGNMVNLESTHLSQPKLAGTASLLTLVAGAVIGGIASSAYGWGPGYDYYGSPGYYGAGYYGGPYAYDYGYDEPYRWGGGYTTTYYTAPVSYGYRYRRVVRPAYAYYRGSYPVVRHRWHRHHHW